MIKKYKSKPKVVEAIQFDGSNFFECKTFLRGNWDNSLNFPNVITHEGVVSVSPGDFVVRGPFDDYYPCKPDIFEKSYEALDE